MSIDDIVRGSRPRLVAWLASADGDLAAAEDAFAEAVERALVRWPTHGVPDNPEAWLLTVARNRQRDRWRSAEHHTAALPPEKDVPAGPGSVEATVTEIPDRRLALLAVLAHPDVDPAARTPLMLNVVLGRTAAEIGALLLVPTATMAARLTRAKKRIRRDGLRFELPGADELPTRLDEIRDAIHATYSVDWHCTGPAVRHGATGEALFLAELLTELVPDDPESHGLAALLCLSASRAAARRGDDGCLIPLEEQDTSLWDRPLLARGEEHLRLAGTSTLPGVYRLQAAIQAVHCARRHSGETDWPALHRLHSVLDRLAPTAGGTVALAVATARCDGPLAGLVVLDRLGERAWGFQPWWVARAWMQEEAGHPDEAAVSYSRALDLSTDPAERDALRRSRDRVARS